MLKILLLGLVIWWTLIYLVRRSRPIPILMYHYVDGAGEKSGLSVTGETLETQIRHMLQQGHTIVSFGDLIKWRASPGGEMPESPVVITFDDGDDAFYTKVYPLLVKYGIPATVFIITDWIGKPGFMTWEQIVSMSPRLVTVGSHTMTHRYLPEIGLEEAKVELAQSKKILEERLKRPVSFLSYPVGGFTPDIARAAKEAGYTAACTTNRGRNFFHHDLYALKRVKMTEKSTQWHAMAAKLSGYYLVFTEIFPKETGGPLRAVSGKEKP